MSKVVFTNSTINLKFTFVHAENSSNHRKGQTKFWFVELILFLFFEYPWGIFFNLKFGSVHNRIWFRSRDTLEITNVSRDLNQIRLGTEPNLRVNKIPHSHVWGGAFDLLEKKLFPLWRNTSSFSFTLLVNKSSEIIKENLKLALKNGLIQKIKAAWIARHLKYYPRSWGLICC